MTEQPVTRMPIDLTEIDLTGKPSFRLSDRLTTLVNEAIRTHGQGEDIVWEGTLMPTPDGGAQYVLFFWMKGAVLGSLAQGSFAVPNPMDLEADQFDDVFRQFVEQLRQARSAQIAQGAPQGRPTMADLAQQHLGRT